MPIDRTLISIAPELTSSPLLHGEGFLTPKQFHTFLKQHNVRGSLRTIYRWLDIPKEHLPRDVQALLTPAPSMWFVQLDAVDYTTPTHVIPLRYLDEAVRTQAAALAVRYVEPPPSALRTVRSLKIQLAQMQQELYHLEQYMEAMHRKDGGNDHGTSRHTVTA